MPTTSANDRKLGSAIQAYVRARWDKSASRADAQAPVCQIDRKLQARIDALGFDAERLLDVPTEDTMSALETLEHEALMEDAGAQSGVAQVRQQEERQFQDATEAAPSQPGVHSRRNHPPGRHGHRRQRS